MVGAGRSAGVCARAGHRPGRGVVESDRRGDHAGAPASSLGLGEGQTPRPLGGGTRLVSKDTRSQGSRAPATVKRYVAPQLQDDPSATHRTPCRSGTITASPASHPLAYSVHRAPVCTRMPCRPSTARGALGPPPSTRSSTVTSKPSLLSMTTASPLSMDLGAQSSAQPPMPTWTVGGAKEVFVVSGAMPVAPSACSPSPAAAGGSALPAPPAPPRSLLHTSSRLSSSPSHTAKLYSQFPSVYASTSASTDYYSPTSHAPQPAPSPMSPAS